MIKKQFRLITILSIIISAALAIVSYCGVFVSSTYEREVASMAAQGTGQDIFDLFLIVPLLLVSLLFMLKNNRVSYFIFSGTIFYILYSFVIYCFGVHFNRLFLFYCLILGASFYTFLLVINVLIRLNVPGWFDNKDPVRSIAYYFLFIAFMFYTLWLKDIIPAVIHSSVPKSVSDYKLLVNPVHVLDTAIVLPGLIITAVLLLKKHALGTIFAPIFLVFVILLSIALAAMVIVLMIKNISEDLSVVVIFFVLAVISAIFLAILMKKVISKV